MAIALRPLHEQVIVILGATGEVGLATADAAARVGARVVLADRGKDRLAEAVSRLGGRAIAVECDPANREQVEGVADAAVRHFGRIDTWVNDVAATVFGRLDVVPDVDHRRVFEANFWGTVNGSLVALPHLRRDGGALVNVGGDPAGPAVPLHGMRTAGKRAVEGFTDTLRAEQQQAGEPVSVSLVRPTAATAPAQVAEAILTAAATPQPLVLVGVTPKADPRQAAAPPGQMDGATDKQGERPPWVESDRDADGTPRHWPPLTVPARGPRATV